MEVGPIKSINTLNGGNSKENSIINLPQSMFMQNAKHQINGVVEQNFNGEISINSSMGLIKVKSSFPLNIGTSVRIESTTNMKNVNLKIIPLGHNTYQDFHAELTNLQEQHNELYEIRLNDSQNNLTKNRIVNYYHISNFAPQVQNVNILTGINNYNNIFTATIVNFNSNFNTSTIPTLSNLQNGMKLKFLITSQSNENISEEEITLENGEIYLSVSISKTSLHEHILKTPIGILISEDINEHLAFNGKIKLKLLGFYTPSKPNLEQQNLFENLNNLNDPTWLEKMNTNILSSIDSKDMIPTTNLKELVFKTAKFINLIQNPYEVSDQLAQKLDLRMFNQLYEQSTENGWQLFAVPMFIENDKITILKLFNKIEQYEANQTTDFPSLNKQFVVETNFPFCGEAIIECLVNSQENDIKINIKTEHNISSTVQKEINDEIESFQISNNKIEIKFSILPAGYYGPFQQLIHNYCIKKPNTLV